MSILGVPSSKMREHEECDRLYSEFIASGRQVTFVRKGVGGSVTIRRDPYQYLNDNEPFSLNNNGVSEDAFPNSGNHQLVVEKIYGVLDDPEKLYLDAQH
jgi:hypothetical protein